MADKRLIDAEPIKKFIQDGLNNHDLQKALGHDAIEILAEIECAPTVDAVEVVRCKDCKHYKEVLGIDSGKPCGYGRCVTPCSMITGIVYDEDFCSYGERRADEKGDDY